MKSILIKRNVKTGSLLFILLLLVASSSVQAQDLLKLIPANASGVVTMDGNSFFRKIDLEQINRLEMFRELDEETQGRRGSKYKDYSKIYKDPSSIGLNILSKCYFFFETTIDTNQWGSSYTYTSMLFALKKSKKFENFIKKISDSTIHKDGAYKYCKTGYNTIVGWNGAQVIVLISTGYGDEKDQLLLKEFKRLTTLTSEQSIKSNKNFTEAQSKSTFDFNYWMNFEPFIGSLYSAMLNLPIYNKLPFIGKDFYKGYYFNTNLNFNKGSITMDATQQLSPEAAQTVKDVYGKGLNPEILKYIHKDHLLGFYSYSLNMKGVKAILDTALTDSIKTKINEGFTELLYESKIIEDPKVKKMQAEIDSMYADLYPPVNYDNYDYTSVDTAVAVEEYYDTTYVEEESVVEEEPNEENVNEEETDEDEVIAPPAVEEYDYTDTTYSDTYLDTAAVAYDYDYTYKQTKEDSLYNIKYDRINKKRDEMDVRKKELLQQKIKELNLSKDFLFELFQGDAMVAITDYFFIDKKYTTYEYDADELKTKEVEKTKKDPFAEFLVGFTLNDVDQANKLISKLTKDSFLIKTNNYYKVGMKWPIKVYVAISNNLLLVTDDEELLKTHFSGFSEGERVSKELQEALLNKTSSGYINLKDIFVRIPYDNLSPDKRATYSLLMNTLGTVTFTSSNYKENISYSDLNFTLTNKIDNSFYEIFRIINEIYKINSHKY